MSPALYYVTCICAEASIRVRRCQVVGNAVIMKVSRGLMDETRASRDIDDRRTSAVGGNEMCTTVRTLYDTTISSFYYPAVRHIM